MSRGHHLVSHYDSHAHWLVMEGQLKEVTSPVERTRQLSEQVFGKLEAKRL